MMICNNNINDDDDDVLLAAKSWGERKGKEVAVCMILISEQQ